jgi:hypothetical protein
VERKSRFIRPRVEPQTRPQLQSTQKAEEEADTFLQENPSLVPLYEIDVVKEAEPYQLTEEAALVELGRAREALERELAVSQRVRPTELEELNLGMAEEP